MRTFETGATRDDDATKPDYEGFISPEVLVAYGAYMHKHRAQPDGNLRDSDNWQKGIPLPQYMKSLVRHTIDLWRAHRKGDTAAMKDLCCAVLFNVQGALFELLRPAPVQMSPRDYVESVLGKTKAKKPFQPGDRVRIRRDGNLCIVDERTDKGMLALRYHSGGVGEPIWIDEELEAA